jgi:hypothetical protein
VELEDLRGASKAELEAIKKKRKRKKKKQKTRRK